jgi:Protein of unknown function (DUF3617)
MLGSRIAIVTVALGLAAMIAPTRAADNTPFKVKPGLWEMTADIERNGIPPLPPEMLARLTPEQRAKLEQQQSGTRHSVNKRRITQADIDKGFEPMAGMDRANCTRTVTSSTPTLRAGRLACTGEMTGGGNYRFEARSPESIIGNWDATMSRGDKTMTMKGAMQGKWLGSDCGGVKPRESD